MTRKIFDLSRKFKQEGGFEEYKSKDETPEELAKYLLSLIPFEPDDFVIDAGSGKNKVWYKNIPTSRKDEYEIDEGRDFLKFNGKADWVVGNPPFNQFINFCYHSCEICNKGFAFIISNGRFNQLTPKRLSDFEAKGFYLSKIHIFNVKIWFGRYYFLIFTRKKSDCISYTNLVF